MTLAAWLLLAMTSWLAMPGDDATQAEYARWEADHEEPVAATRARAERVASGLAAVAGSNAKRALELAAVAVLETRLAVWVSDGSCNLARWRAAHPDRAPCDDGHAWGPFQVHPGRHIDALVGHHVTTVELLESIEVPWRLYAVHPEAWTTRARAARAARTWAGAHPWTEQRIASIERKTP